MAGVVGASNPNSSSWDNDLARLLILPENLQFSNDLLGEGAFGRVVRGMLNKTTKCAIKSTSVQIYNMDTHPSKNCPDNKHNGALNLTSALRKEIRTMAKLEKHEYVVELLGICAVSAADGIKLGKPIGVHILSELGIGDLRSHLIRNRVKYQQKLRADDSASGCNHNEMKEKERVLTMKQMLKWGEEIAAGMEHLKKKKVVHVDLALRNIILFENGTVKISDFGHSCHLYRQQVYQKNKDDETEFPFQWLALESLQSLEFSPETDVWSFGIILWEIFSLAKEPFPQITWPALASFYAQGGRLSLPAFATPDIYSVMRTCWHQQPAERPTFQQLQHRLMTLRENFPLGSIIPPIDVSPKDKNHPYPALSNYVTHASLCNASTVNNNSSRSQFTPSDLKRSRNTHEDTIGPKKFALFNVDDAEPTPMDTTFVSTTTLDNEKPGLWFNMTEPISQFFGRQEFFEKLHNSLQSSSSSNNSSSSSSLNCIVTVLSQLEVVSGLGGVGKTETARMYAFKYRKWYNNVIWIDAQNFNTMQSTFVQLAQKLEISLTTAEGMEKPIQQVVQQVYENIMDQGQTLVIFDNAEGYTVSTRQNKDGDGIRDFLPASVHPDLPKPRILVTSRNQLWKPGSIKVLPLDCLSIDQSINFLLTGIGQCSDSPENRRELEELARILGGLPLALQQTVAYLQLQSEIWDLCGISGHIQKYCQDFKANMKNIMKDQNLYSRGDSAPTVFATWNITLKKIQQLKFGHLSIQLMETLSFLFADKIPVNFLFRVSIDPDDLPSQFKDLAQGLHLLQKYSMIKQESSGHISIHRQVQFVIMEQLKETPGKYEERLHTLIKRCAGILKEDEDKLAVNNSAESSLVLLQMQQIYEEHLKPLTYCDPDFLVFAKELGIVFQLAGTYEKASKIHEQTLEKQIKFSPKNHDEDSKFLMARLDTQHKLAWALEMRGLFAESIALLEIVVEGKKQIVGEDHPSTLSSMHNLGCSLLDDKQLAKAVEIFSSVWEKRKRILPENDMHTLNSQNRLALTLHCLGDYDKAASLAEDCLARQLMTLGGNHRHTLNTQRNLALVLRDRGELERSLELLENVHEQQKIVHGEFHPITLITVQAIISVLEIQGEVQRGLKLWCFLYEHQEGAVGEKLPRTLETLELGEKLRRGVLS